jgi:hypothetical protein
MKTLTTFLMSILLVCLLSLGSCSSRQPETTTIRNSNQINLNESKVLTVPSPVLTPGEDQTDTAIGPRWVEGVKYYYLTIGDKTYHGTKLSEKELKTCVGEKIPVDSGDLVPTNTPCGNYNLKGRKVSKDDEREAEIENEACPDGSDKVADSGGPDAGDVIDLAKAVKEELIDAEPEGHNDGQQYMKLSLSLKINMPIYVRIPPGTVFLPSGGDSSYSSLTQRMISTIPVTKRLEVPGENTCVSVPVVCLDIELKVPQSGQPFSIGNMSSLQQSSEVGRLVNSAEFRREAWAIQQGTLWIVRSNPSRDHMYFNRIPNEDLKRIRTLLQQVGISTYSFKIFSGLD